MQGRMREADVLPYLQSVETSNCLYLMYNPILKLLSHLSSRSIASKSSRCTHNSLRYSAVDVNYQVKHTHTIPLTEECLPFHVF